MAMEPSFSTSAAKQSQNPMPKRSSHSWDRFLHTNSILRLKNSWIDKNLSTLDGSDHDVLDQVTLHEWVCTQNLDDRDHGYRYLPPGREQIRYVPTNSNKRYYI